MRADRERAEIAKINRGIELDPNASGAWLALAVLISFLEATIRRWQRHNAPSSWIPLTPKRGCFHALALLGKRTPEEVLRSTNARWL